MTALRRLADPRLRPAWYGAAAALALAAFIMTGAVYWFLTPWRFAGLLAAAAAVTAWAWGLFGRHEGRHADKVTERPRRELALPDPEIDRYLHGPAPDTLAEFASMGRLRGEMPVYAGHSPDWAPRFVPGREPPPWPPGPITPQVLADRYGPQAVQALVFDDPPPGREWDAPLDVRHHAGLPGRVRGCTEDHGAWAAKAKDHPAAAPEPASRAQQAINDDLRAAGLKVYASEDDAVNSIMMRALDGPLAIEGARGDG